MLNFQDVATGFKWMFIDVLYFASGCLHLQIFTNFFVASGCFVCWQQNVASDF